jgi:putative GTP pyrophosphokinase
MGVPKDFDAEYEQIVAPLGGFSAALERLIQDLLRAAGIRFHTVVARVKSRDSAVRKVISGGDARPLSSLYDMLGIRIITYFRDEVDAVARVIEREFAIDEASSVDKRVVLDPDRFGYLSLHFVAQLSHDRVALTEYRQYGGIKFEIQIRSILQHSWAEIEHDLGYKSKAAVPRSIKRRFSRLAGLLEIADDEFVGIRNELAAHRASTSETIGTGSWDVEIDQDSLFSFTMISEEIMRLDRFIADAVDGILAQRPDRSYVGQQAPRLVAVGFDVIDDLNRYANEQSNLLKKFVSSRPSLIDTQRRRRPAVPRGISFYYLGMLRHAQDLLAGTELAGTEEGSIYPGISDSSLRLSLESAMDESEFSPET